MGGASQPLLCHLSQLEPPVYLQATHSSSDTRSRYNQETSASSLAIEPPQQSTILNLFHPPSITTGAPYSQDGTAFYPSAAHVFPGIDVRARLNSNIDSSATGMAHSHSHSHRTAPLPHPGPQISARDQYNSSTPSFRRGTEHPSRSPSFPGATLRHHPLSTTPSPLTGFAAPNVRMDSNQYGNRAGQNNVPPLGPTQTLGSLHYIDGTATDVKVDISGTVDKGFFMSPEGEWTCYRRNYLACVCSFTMTPHYVAAPMQFTPTGGTQALQVYGFAMCISAVVADNEQHSIELVQHTPKRDKGPISKPEKIPMRPKPSPSAHHGLGMYSDGPAAPGNRGIYTTDGLIGSQVNGQHLPTEYTFERIQFKQATQNNGKRRAAQQYYHLAVELWANVGGQHSDQYVKIAVRKSAKMIVRGRSPGHYQNERRGSQGSGPGGSAGNMGAYSSLGGVGDFGPAAVMGGSSGPGYGGGYDSRAFNSMRNHEISGTITPVEEDKTLDHTKSYQYYSGPMYDGHIERVDMFNHHRMGPESMLPPHLSSDSKIKHEHELPRPFRSYQTHQRHCGTFEDKSDPRGYYPSPAEMEMSITLT